MHAELFAWLCCLSVDLCFFSCAVERRAAVLSALSETQGTQADTLES